MNTLCLALTSLFFALVCGCSAQKTTANSSPAGECNVNAKAICQAMRNSNPVMDGTGISYDNAGTEQNGVGRTSTFYSQYNLQSGNPVMVECYINTHTRAVVYAKSSLGKPLSAEDVDFLRSQGMCEQ